MSVATSVIRTLILQNVSIFVTFYCVVLFSHAVSTLRRTRDMHSPFHGNPQCLTSVLFYMVKIHRNDVFGLNKAWKTFGGEFPRSNVTADRERPQCYQHAHATEFYGELNANSSIGATVSSQLEWNLPADSEDWSSLHQPYTILVL